MSADFEAQLQTYRERLEGALDRVLPDHAHYPGRLHEAMRYACDGGKRLRAQLVYLTGEALLSPVELLDAPACAVELIHAYSLVHDDLPSMDDDDLRRGRPTTHRAYDEATAILVGDALQTLAFEVLSHNETHLGPEQRLRMIAVLAQAAGSRGMVGGQSVDIDSENRQLSLAELEALHIHKTGALIRACLQMACATATDIDPSHAEALDRYGKCIGLAFQIQDDVLDLEGNSATLGKTAGKDEASGKCTYPSILGLPAARERAADLFARAYDALDVFGDRAQPLRRFATRLQLRSF